MNSFVLSKGGACELTLQLHMVSCREMMRVRVFRSRLIIALYSVIVLHKINLQGR